MILPSSTWNSTEDLFRPGISDDLEALKCAFIFVRRIVEIYMKERYFILKFHPTKGARGVTVIKIIHQAKLKFLARAKFAFSFALSITKAPNWCIKMKLSVALSAVVVVGSAAAFTPLVALTRTQKSGTVSSIDYL